MPKVNVTCVNRQSQLFQTWLQSCNHEVPDTENLQGQNITELRKGGTKMCHNLRKKSLTNLTLNRSMEYTYPHKPIHGLRQNLKGQDHKINLFLSRPYMLSVLRLNEIRWKVQTWCTGCP